MQPEPISHVAPALPGPRILSQLWTEVTFLHWRVDPAHVAAQLPAGTRPDVYDGSAWVGLIPFRLSRTAFLGGPAVPYFGTFPEVNVRLYSVDGRGRRAVVFASLEASHLLPVLTAQAVFGLPYRWASMRMGHRNGLVGYRTRRHTDPEARSHIIARPLESVTADPLADYLTARWAYHERHLGRTWFGANQHEPWPLRRAELVHLDDTLLARAGFPDVAERAPDSVLYSAGVRTEFTLPRAL